MPLDTKAFLMVVLIGGLGVAALFLFALIPYLGFLFLLQGLIAYLGIGVAYGNLAQQHGYRLEMQSTAIYGGLAAFLTSVFPALLVLLFDSAPRHSAIAFLMDNPIMVYSLGAAALILGAIGGAIYVRLMPQG